MRAAAFSFAILLLSGCASNIKDTDILASNSIILPPTSGKTIFLQNRNSSDNQAVSLNDLSSRLTAKGYQLSQDPNTAAYVMLTNIVYCNQTKLEVPVEDIVASGYGSGVGSSVMGGLHSLTSMASMAGPQGAILGGAASMGLSAAEGIGSAVGNMFSGPSRPGANENINYACVVDVQITERVKTGGQPSHPQPGTPSPPGVYQTRLAASVHQKKLDEEEATPLVQQRLSASVAGHF
ncbi:putative Lipoprotein, TraT related [Nitrospira sp. KM1]|uniref:complement resistance protein TraT n=1 Tax=Nitrospira sp. KM1 TaxID=1936990 RepID=UPI0013A73368|nr:complement resistance protein TraT [Nitrospira sp. KM1]BCA53027.1 putative Lipoprotein, TraT related [Nitrospira sp. KM1]